MTPDADEKPVAPPAGDRTGEPSLVGMEVGVPTPAVRTASPVVSPSPADEQEPLGFGIGRHLMTKPSPSPAIGDVEKLIEENGNDQTRSDRDCPRDSDGNRGNDRGQISRRASGRSGSCPETYGRSSNCTSDEGCVEKLIERYYSKGEHDAAFDEAAAMLRSLAAEKAKVEASDKIGRKLLAGRDRQIEALRAKREF